MDLSVIIPIKDERDNLRRLHEQLRRTLDPLNLLYEVIKAFAAVDKGVDRANVNDSHRAECSDRRGKTSP